MNSKKKNLIPLFIVLTCFFALFSYPFVRSSVAALFYEHYTSDDYSYATFFSVVTLMVFISISNFLQNKIGIQKLYFGTTCIMIALLGGSFLGIQAGIKEFALSLIHI